MKTFFKLKTGEPDIKISKHLTLREFQCRCKQGLCKEIPVADGLLETFERFRELVGHPLKITSGYRCPHRNSKTKGANPKSTHMEGRAIDVAINQFILKDHSWDSLERMARDAGAVYTYFRPAKGFIHFNV